MLSVLLSARENEAVADILGEQVLSRAIRQGYRPEGVMLVAGNYPCCVASDS